MVLVIFPVAFTYGTSMLRWYLGTGTIVFNWFGNYIRLVQDANFYWGLARSAYYTVACVSIEMGLGLLISYWLYRYKRFGQYYIIPIIIPMFMPPVSVANMFRLMMDPELGLFNWILENVGLPTSKWSAGESTAMLSAVLVDVWQWTPFVILVLYAAFQAVPIEQVENARVDGASQWFIFRHVFLGLIKPAIVIAFLFRLVDTLRIFDYVYTLTSGGPGDVTQVLNYYIFRVAFEQFSIGYASALSIIWFWIVYYLSLRILIYLK